MISKILQFVKEKQSDIMVFTCVVLISFLSFAFGYIIAKNQERPELKFEDIINYQYQKDEKLSHRNHS